MGITACFLFFVRDCTVDLVASKALLKELRVPRIEASKFTSKSDQLGQVGYINIPVSGRQSMTVCS